MIEMRWLIENYTRYDEAKERYVEAHKPPVLQCRDIDNGPSMWTPVPVVSEDVW